MAESDVIGQVTSYIRDLEWATALEPHFPPLEMGTLYLPRSRCRRTLGGAWLVPGHLRESLGLALNVA